MDISFSQVFKGFGLALFTGLFIVKLKSINAKSKAIEQFKSQPLKDLSCLQKMKEGQQVYVKAKLKNQQSNKRIIRKYTIPISYNQYFLQEPSDLLILKGIYNQQAYYPIFNKNSFNFVDDFGKQKKLIGIKKMIGDVFTIKKQYEKEQIGFLTSVWGSFCYFFETLIDIVRKAKFHDHSLSHIPETRTPFIMGPIIGALHYTIGLLTDKFFVLKIKLENGQFSTAIMSESFGSLLNFYQDDLTKTRLEGFLFGSLGMIFGYLAYRDFKKSALYKNMKQLAIRGQKKWLYVENVTQDKFCIVCYTNCRNLIFFDCKHLIMCWDCLQNLKQQNCPICKKQIIDARVILENLPSN